ncbi:MAG TPA: hypothetical protein QGF35_07120 [Dehalococcoidia bacterium]|nr:hypothetical protein [Dehalococcoidia bacterium]
MRNYRRSYLHLGVLVPALITLVLGGSALFAACDDGEDRPGIEVIGSGSGSGSGSGTGIGIEPGVVGEKPEGATQVDVVLREWEVQSSVASIRAGQIYFLADNVGPVDPHELVIIRTDLPSGELQVIEGRVPEDEVDIIDEIEPFSAGSKASIVVDLPPGKYALICNIAEIEDGELESHYQLGMYMDFEVVE